MAERADSRLWTARAIFVLAALTVMFFLLLPLETTPRRIAPPVEPDAPPPSPPPKVKPPALPPDASTPAAPPPTEPAASGLGVSQARHTAHSGGLVIMHD